MLLRRHVFVTVTSLKEIKDCQADVETMSDVAVNLSGKSVSSTGRPCKRKSWFYHNIIIRG